MSFVNRKRHESAKVVSFLHQKHQKAGSVKCALSLALSPSLSKGVLKPSGVTYKRRISVSESLSSFDTSCFLHSSTSEFQTLASMPRSKAAST